MRDHRPSPLDHSSAAYACGKSAPYPTILQLRVALKVHLRKRCSSPPRNFFSSTVVQVRPLLLHSNEASHAQPQPRPHSILSSLALHSLPSLFLSVPPAAPSLHHHLPWYTTEIAEISEPHREKCALHSTHEEIRKISTNVFHQSVVH